VTVKEKSGTLHWRVLVRVIGGVLPMCKHCSIFCSKRWRIRIIINIQRKEINMPKLYKIVYFTGSAFEADLVIYKTDIQSGAGWLNHGKADRL